MHYDISIIQQLMWRIWIRLNNMACETARYKINKRFSFQFEIKIEIFCFAKNYKSRLYLVAYYYTRISFDLIYFTKHILTYGTFIIELLCWITKVFHRCSQIKIEWIILQWKTAVHIVHYMSVSNIFLYLIEITLHQLHFH